MTGGFIIDFYQLGSTGKTVKKIQAIFVKMGYQIKVDGIYGENLKNTVIDYQIKHNLNIDGIVGPHTFESLLKDSGLSEAEAYINSRDYYSKTHYLLYTDLSTYQVYLFEGYNKNWELIKKYLASIGKQSTPTLKGIFTVKAKGPGYGGEKYGYQVKWYTQYYQNYLFHSILFNLDGSIFDGRLGMEISDGCIRLNEEDAKYIYDNVPYGSLVIIQ